MSKLERFNRWFDLISLEYLPFVIIAGIAVTGIGLVNLEESRNLYTWWVDTYLIGPNIYGWLMVFVSLFAIWRREDGENLFYYSLPMILLLLILINFNIQTGNAPAVTTGVRIYAFAVTLVSTALIRVNIRQRAELRQKR